MIQTLKRGAAAIAAVVFLAGAHAAQAGINVWTNIGPPGQEVRALVVDPITPGTLYLGTRGGVFKSNDAGLTWDTASEGLGGDPEVTVLAIDPTNPSTLYAGTYAGFFKSADGASSWSAASEGLGPAPHNFTQLAIDRTEPGTLYAARYYGGVFKSTNGAGSWTQLSPLASSLLSALVVDPSTTGTLYTSWEPDFCPEVCRTALLRSTDGGDTWSDIGSGTILAVDPMTPSTLYAGHRVAKSTDGGSTWNAADTGLPPAPLRVNAIAIDPSTASRLYAGTRDHGVFKSTDGAGTWRPINAALPDVDVRALAIDPITPGRLYAVTDGGVFSIEQVDSCTGDCDNSGAVRVNELVTLMNIGLGEASPAACPVPDGATVGISLILQAVDNGLNGCEGSNLSSDLYVAASGALDGDGSSSNPYRRITDAVARARAERATGAIPPEEEIRIHVAPGTYVGSFSPTQLQNNPEYEVLPIILNVPGLALLGSTVLVRDDRGLPTGTEPGSETVLEPDRSLANRQYLLLVTPTADGAVGNGVTIEGFALDGREGAFVTAAVFADRVSDFRISNNLIHHAGFGIITRLASGTIEGNLLVDHGEAGAVITGGSLAQPATVLIHANRAARNKLHGFINASTGNVANLVDPGGNILHLLQPLQATFDRNDSEDVQNIPDTLVVTLSDNDASDNGNIGIRFMASTHANVPGLPYGGTYQTQDDSQPLTSFLTANVLENTCAGNGYYGVAMEAGFTVRAEPRQFILTLAGSFEGNSIVGNGRAGALFNFTYWAVAVGLDSLFTKKFAEGSTYQVTDIDGELAGFDYDHPLTDPVSGTVLNNTLTLNGAEVPHGTSITPESAGAEGAPGVR